MPLSVFLGEPVHEVTEYEYDQAGRLTRSVTTRPSPWTDEDRGWLMALLAEEREVCPGCGQPLEVCRDPATAGSWSPVTTTCEACRILDATRDNYAEGGRPQRGLYLGVRRS